MDGMNRASTRVLATLGAIATLSLAMPGVASAAELPPADGLTYPTATPAHRAITYPIGATSALPGVARPIGTPVTMPGAAYSATYPAGQPPVATPEAVAELATPAPAPSVDPLTAGTVLAPMASATTAPATTATAPTSPTMTVQLTEIADQRTASLALQASLVNTEADRIAAEQAAKAKKLRQKQARARIAKYGVDPKRYAKPRDLGRAMAKALYGWEGRQFACYDKVIMGESGWNPRADNPNSSAYGIPQALPGSKMASAGSDWRTNPATQLKWGLGYVRAAYGTPCRAWSFKQDHGWY